MEVKKEELTLNDLLEEIRKNGQQILRILQLGKITIVEWA